MKFRELVAIARDVLLWLVGAVCLVAAVGMTLTDHVPAGTLLFGAGILLCLVSTLSRFEFIKGLGIEAKTRALDAKLDQADVLLEQIRDISAVTAKMAFQFMARIGHWDSHLSKDEMLTLSDTLIKQLNSVAVSSVIIEDCMQPVHNLNLQTLVRPVLEAIDKHLQLKQQDAKERMQKVSPQFGLADAGYQKLRSDFDVVSSFVGRLHGAWHKEPVELLGQVEYLINDMPFSDPAEKETLLHELSESIKDARHYQFHRKFRDREKWLSTPYA